VMDGHSREIGDGYTFTTVTWFWIWTIIGDRARRGKLDFLNGWWVQQGAAVGAHFPPVSIKDHTVGSVVASLRVPNT